MEKGGYDAVTATRMAWREITKQFPQLPKEHEGAMSYQLKALYYKNLAAYEIERYWGERPPAPSLLEHLTAKGGDVRKRTHDTMTGNSTPTTMREPDETPDSSQQTPKQEKLEPDDQGSASRYPSRLRQQPKPVQLYQPDPTPSRTMRMRNTNSPQPNTIAPPSYTNASSNVRDPNFKIENYEPRPSMPLTLRPLLTPGSNSDMFYQRKAANNRPRVIQRAPMPQDLLKFQAYKPIFDGPNIYTRCVQGLKSGIRREQDFALHHLVKVSHERGDKFKLEGFPTLAEAILEKLIDITELAFGVNFKISYNDARGTTVENTLNAVYGTEGLGRKLDTLDPLLAETEIEPEDYIPQLEKLNEASLVLRNMVCLEENAIFLSKMALFRDLLIIMLNLPRHSRFSEIRQYALDVAEMTTRYWDKMLGNDIYMSLVKELESEDRGKVLSALRALYRFDAEADRVHPLNDIPASTIEKLVHYCLLDDDELVEASIDFLFAWTAFPDNLTWILNTSPELFPSISLRLTNLLLHRAEAEDETTRFVNKQPTASATNEIPVPVIPPELHQHLLHFPEPERSSRWLRCCFEEAPDDHITQISIWQAYSQRFIHNGHSTAADFIKTVSQTLTGAQAQVTQDLQGRQKFIIKGIRPRRVLVDLRGIPWFKCQWQLPLRLPANQAGVAAPTKHMTCSTWCASPEALWKHMVGEHAQIPRTGDGKFQSKDVPAPEGGFKCGWVGCRKNNTIDTPAALAGHFKTHVPENAEQNKELIYKLAGLAPPSKDETTLKHTFYVTPRALDGHPYGIGFMSGVLLTNIARYVGRRGEEKERRRLMGKLFGPQVRSTLFDMWSKHRTLGRLIFDLINLIEEGEAPAKKASQQSNQDGGAMF